MTTHGNECRKGSDWPFRTMLWAGFFGSGTRGGRTLRNRTVLGLLVFALVPIVARDLELELGRIIGALFAPLGVGIIVWAYIRYLAELDDLCCLLQLKAFAFSYGIAMTLASFWLGFHATGFEFAGSASGAAVFFTIMLAELLRGPVLVILARRVSAGSD